ncbi:MAG TPA: glycoside hydrolase family 20 zincin-like fold domain-containing protein [Terriglobia bacterium]|nr:glycoside hydrolase family 20 zincin-like fold domain-containing protein [Terriglobia bacterium]
MKCFNLAGLPGLRVPTRCLLSFLIVMAGGGIAGNLLAMQPLLIPQPRQVESKAQPFQVETNLKIVLATPVAPQDRYAAQSIQRELELVTGREFPIVALPEPPKDTPAIIMGTFDQPQIQTLLKARRLSTQGVEDQGYVLEITGKEVLVAGKDSAGLFYGAQTLRQLVVSTGAGAEIMGARVRDWPALQYRGTQVDLSRGPVPKLSYLKRIVRTIAQFKLNQLYMYMEDSFRLNGQPLVGLLSDTLSRSDWNDLVAYAARYHVEIVPATEACGHLHKILRFEQYSGLAERPHGHVLAPQDPGELGFLNSMYEQMLPVFPSSIYHIGCDETFELGKERTKDLIAKEGYGKVYVDNLTRVAKLVESYNKQVMFWGDIAVEHPDMISSLPKTLIVASWEYSAQPSYSRWLKPFEGTGMRIFVCPWAGNTSLMVPDYEEAAYNIEHFIADGKKAGAIGAVITIWNDDGETLYGPNWWPIIYGAACAWELHEPGVEDFNRKFDWAFYRNTDHRFARAIADLGHLNEVMRAGKPVETYDMRYGGTGDSLFWSDPFSALGREEVQQGLPVASLIRQTAENAYTVFADSASRAMRNSDTLASLEFAALRLDALGMRYQYAQEISDRYQDAVQQDQANHRGSVEGDISDITSTNGRLQDLRDYTTRLTEMYRKLWLSENLPTWLPNVLQLYQRNSDLWQDLIEKFAQIRNEYGQGRPLPSPESLGLLTKQPGAQP